jgi:hypothetical protein
MDWNGICFPSDVMHLKLLAFLFGLLALSILAILRACT